ncbi:ABC transporter transmembrane domain-containing protein [Streptomyces sp. NPDC059740]|uniref:ABC transporter transmembrane domain-containing protein n=1 Tax=Streptomyces sp. NPDC059740 TaxID=3346926 RepID=UPI00364FC804
MQIRDLPHPDPGEPDVRSGGRFLWWLFGRQWGGQVRALLWGLLHTCAVAALPLPVGAAVQAAVDRSAQDLLRAGGVMLALGTAVALGDTMLHRAAVTNWITSVARVQQLLARRAVELGDALTRQVAAGEVVAVGTGDVEKIGWFVEALSRFTAAACAGVGVCVALVVYQPALGVVVAVGVPVMALVVLPLLPPATRRADKQREKAGLATELASDTVAGLRVLRGVGGEQLFLRRYRHASQEVRHAAVRSARMWSLIAAVQVLLPGLLLTGVVAMGVAMVDAGRVPVGTLVTVYSAVTFLLLPLRHLEEITMAYSFSRPSARRAARVLALRRPTGGAAARGALRGDLVDPVSGVRACEGELTAVVCGDPDTAGELAERWGGHAVRGAAGEPSVLLGGTALDQVDRESARTAVLVQDKDPVLLSGTLGELLDVPSTGRIPAAEALAAAQCEDVLAALARGSADADGDPLAAHLTERGRSLSGGQRQRLALARSLVADPEVLVLDEPTSAVDSHTEAAIAAGLRKVRAGRTTLVLTSSPLLLDRADRVVFLREGRAEAAGDHHELLRSCAAYRAVVTREVTGPDPRPGEGAPAGAAPHARPLDAALAGGESLDPLGEL